MSEMELHDESVFTPWAELGWSSWNGMSPEVEVCDFFAGLVRMLKPAFVVETGVGQGYMTRAIVQVLGENRLRCYESDAEWRKQLEGSSFWDSRVSLSVRPTPHPALLGSADLCFFDSDPPVRLNEIRLWHENAQPGAVALIHDTGEHHVEGTYHKMIRELIVGLGMQGVFLRNPRGSFLAFKP